MAWSRWTYAQTSCDSAETDNDGSQCGLYQDEASPVFFLNFAPSRAPRRGCRLPYGKAVFVPIAAFVIDPAGEDSTLSAQVLEDEADEALESMRDLMLIVDGKPMVVDDTRAVQPIRHSAQLPPVPNFFSCQGIDGYADMLLEPVYVTGYFALLPPPPVGEHTLSYAGALEVFGVSETNAANMVFSVKREP